jgi:PilZ domain
MADRRRHPRYRFSEPMKVCCSDGACLDGMSVEISQSGMSGMVQGSLLPGDVVRLQPVTGVIAAAVVRHKLGMLYGFEFLELAGEQARKIAERCRKCEPWRANGGTV